ncbi:NnrS family protein [Aliiroseovarius sp. F20344]|uniref:NnrS family protein n=1 Tax=Aliiroseovarius sp. F20344 TaxID=2926414 RepID=UPI001FF4731E|nr:NnrS family protein [Aliiroseovarius sp. F20344]MCK0143947.1 NnrS family protein [Aliiroseovarius sp. F20344]
MIILTGAYRVFFPAALLFAGVAIPLWIMSFAGATSPNNDPMLWHQHEMLWGYLPAALAGFLFTAIPNWTGRPTLPPAVLATLFALWLAGRVGMFVAPDALPSQLITMAFLPLTAALALRELIAAGNKRNYVVGAVIFGFAVSQALFLWHDRDIGLSAGFALALILIVHIGGRVTPAFSRNWLKKRGATRLPAEFGPVDKAALGLTVATAVIWIVTGDSLVTGLSAAAASLSLALRLSRWSGWAVRAEPLLFALHMAYLWLIISTALLAAACLSAFATIGQAHHALGAGAVGSMTVIVMLRALLGHSGRPIEATRFDTLILIALHLGAALRVIADWTGDPVPFYHAGGTLWAGAMIAFAIRAFPIAISPRL